MSRHITIPIFVPHLGCPQNCVFCNQYVITGQPEFSVENAVKIIEDHLRTVAPSIQPEIAFFGGSFTGIDRKLMISLLDIARSYLESGRVSGIRCSTRPDYISDEILEILKEYGLTTVELGIQSLNDRVLSASQRGHTAADTLTAIDKILAAGLNFVGQMMLGLPESSLSDELDCARAIADAGATGCRIYPTVVFRGTELERMTLRGRYTPLTLSDTILRGTEVMEVFVDAGVKILRLGLCETDSLHQRDGAIAGGYHPAIGELCASELYYRRIRAAISTHPAPVGKELVFEIPKGDLSKAIGHKKTNKERIMREFSPKSIHFLENSELSDYEIRLISSQSNDTNDRKALRICD